MLYLAYVDPGSGLLLWQMIAAAVVGCFFYLKKVRAILFRLMMKPFRKAPAEVGAT